MESRRLRDAFGRFGTGVAVAIARSHCGVPSGVTINSFVSVSLDPPLVAFGLASRAHCLSHFLEAPAVAISVLRHDQKWIAANFSRPSAARWTGMPIVTSPSRQLVVRDALVAFECVPERHVTAGDHVVLMLSVRHVLAGAAGAPLLFFSSGYGSFLPDHGSQSDWGGACAAMGWG
ncbi:MAG TPA: flavin reductase family protein [Steroidobacteraceae bacterium]|nr:flavin reductase family protein [Steroidobacteraceae bacterium]